MIAIAAEYKTAFGEMHVVRPNAAIDQYLDTVILTV